MNALCNQRMYVANTLRRLDSDYNVASQKWSSAKCLSEDYIVVPPGQYPA